MTRAVALAALWLAACARPGGKKQVTATLETSLGDITISLDSAHAPKTVENFVALAKGEKEFLDPRDHKRKKAPFYDGLTFHRVIPGFMIQAGDPAGDGSGDVGFTIPDEISPTLKFDRPGLVGMANFGPNTAASQFFITLSPQPDLNGRHAIFGEVVSGMDVANKIAAVPRDESFSRDKPLKPVYIVRVVIEESARAAH